MHFRHYFHSAGHGTFFSGHIRIGSGSARNEHDVFTWVYDCGSKRATHLKTLVIAFVEKLGNRKRIDLMCVSHFDSDHVCGLELLLEQVYVDVLVLPYLTIEARLSLAAELTEEAEPAASNVAALTLDPVGYLRQRGLAENVGRIVFVRGGNPEETVDGVDTRDEPPTDVDSEKRGTRDTEPFLRDPSTAPGHDDPEYGALSSASALALGMVSHIEPWIVAGAYEFVFYNTALTAGATPKSRHQLVQVVNDVETIVNDYGLMSRTTPKPKWLEALKKCYGDHFGKTPKRRNDISLCVFGQPLVQGPFKRCELFRHSLPHLGRSLPIGASSKPGVLLTGDICLNHQELAALKKHLTPSRWNQIHVMQIPHHGSQHNWEAGNSAGCVQKYSVICAAGTTHHPHADVLRDLASLCPQLATYVEAIRFDFHN